MAHGLNIRVPCEGVETEKEKEKVVLAGSDYVQGFHYSRVLPQSEADDFYSQYKLL
jgi:EAL domain-containing protein (putative c-di-GMP-specific phosphodiesterase class I)